MIPLCLLLINVIMSAHAAMSHSRSIEYIFAERDNVKLDLMSRSERGDEKEIEVSFVPLYCKIGEKQPEVCLQYTCTVKFAGNTRSLINIKPYYDQTYASNCSELSKALEKFDDHQDSELYSWRWTHDPAIVNLTKTKWAELNARLPMEGCSVIKLPEVNNGEDWRRCVQFPFQAKEQLLSNDWQELTYTVTYTNGSRDSEKYLVPNGNARGDRYAEGVRGLFGGTESMTDYVQLLMAEQDCYHEILLLNKLPVPVTIKVWSDKTEAVEVVLKPTKSKKNGFWQSWYTIVISDKVNVDVHLALTKIEAVTTTFDYSPDQMAMHQPYTAEKNACFDKSKLSDSRLVIS